MRGRLAAIPVAYYQRTESILFHGFLAFILFVAARYAQTCRSLFCRSVGHAFNEINEVLQQTSRRQFVRRGEIWYTGSLALLYINAKIGEFCPKRSLGSQNTEGCKRL